MKKINVLIIGRGGREHALAWKIKQSPQAGIIYVAPGNPGTAMLGCQNIPIELVFENFALLAQIALHLNIGLVVVGPEHVLADGIVQVFNEQGIYIFGPGQASIIEYDKAYAKKLMREVGIPTADFEIFGLGQRINAIDYANSKQGRVVVKASGLARGKGVSICNDMIEAREAIENLLCYKTCGIAGETIVIEERLQGSELSFHALCDGEHVKMFPIVKDYKHLTADPYSQMTGSMGAYGPLFDDALVGEVERKIVIPCLEELTRRKIPFKGCLYPGIMLTKDGPKVLEFNARFGDPEAQVYMRTLEKRVDFIEVLLASVQGRLDQIALNWRKETCVCIGLAAYGYPKKPRSGDEVFFEEHMNESNTDPIIFHAGTAWKNGILETSGGRVLNVTTLLRTHSHDSYAYQLIENGSIKFAGMQYRKDIGKNVKI